MRPPTLIHATMQCRPARLPRPSYRISPREKPSGGAPPFASARSLQSGRSVFRKPTARGCQARRRVDDSVCGRKRDGGGTTWFKRRNGHGMSEIQRRSAILVVGLVLLGALAAVPPGGLPTYHSVLVIATAPGSQESGADSNGTAAPPGELRPPPIGIPTSRTRSGPVRISPSERSPPRTSPSCRRSGPSLRTAPTSALPLS